MAEGVRSSRRIARLQRKSQAVAQTRQAVALAALGYIRVSTEEQAAHGHGLEVQERAVRAFAESQGYQLLEVLADPGVSGATRPADRPGFGTLYKSAVPAAVLLVWKFDRLARQIVHAVTAVAELGERGVAVRSVTEPIDTATPMGRTIFAVLAGMAEQERQAITERTWHGRKAKAASGGYAGGASPYGYRRNGEGGLEVDQAEAMVVLKIFELAGRGLGPAAIARTLNSLGLTTRRGLAWRHGAVGYLLDNPKYRGEVEYLFRWAGGETHVLRQGAHQAIAQGGLR